MLNPLHRSFGGAGPHIVNSQRISCNWVRTVSFSAPSFINIEFL